MFRNRFIGFVFAAALAFRAQAADVVVHTVPPRDVVETRGPAPGPK
jgi:hypothetical protein